MTTRIQQKKRNCTSRLLFHSVLQSKISKLISNKWINTFKVVVKMKNMSVVEQILPPVKVAQFVVYR